MVKMINLFHNYIREVQGDIPLSLRDVGEGEYFSPNPNNFIKFITAYDQHIINKHLFNKSYILYNMTINDSQIAY
jgi:hypothetical protein